MKSQKRVKGSLMIQGTHSDAGKTVTVAGICRLLHRYGVSVAPFKPQNMALNSAVTVDGGEIGRAQALQAIACGIEATTDMNPVLLKPSSDRKSQVIINGQAVDELHANRFGNIKALAFDQVLAAYDRLRSEYDVVVVEGAGSPAEINLRVNDIANMGFAEAVNTPVVLVGDIDRGGVFAHLTGTLNLLSSSEQNRIRGFIINRFRGDLSLLQGGLDWLTRFTEKPVLGVLPYIQQLKLDAEDAIDPDGLDQSAEVSIKVPVLPRISNHTDFDPLRWYPSVKLEFIPGGESLEGADLIIIPGSKNVREDLHYLREQGWDRDIERHLRYGGKVVGVCGGFQMLGMSIHDPLGIESESGSTEGLRLLDFETTLKPRKALRQVTGDCFIEGRSTSVVGYEIHCGISSGAALERPFAKVSSDNNAWFNDGAISSDEQIIGTYLHGLFEKGDVLGAILHWVNKREYVGVDWTEVRERELDRLADLFEEHLDIELLLNIIDPEQ